MKTFTLSTLTGVSVSVMLCASCTKNQSEESPVTNNFQQLCDVAVFTQQYTNETPVHFFNKTYDLSGRTLTHIDAPLYSGGTIWDTVSLDLTYDANKIYFISSENSSDTGLVVYVDNLGRPTRADVGQIIDEGFGPQEFTYEGGRLKLITIDNDWMRIWFRYDQHGNNRQIVTDSSDGLPRINHVYEYNTTAKKELQQFYLDEARGFSFNVLTILQAAGFFRELHPVHQRTRSTVSWGSYVAYDYKQQDHIFDNSGRLMQYKTASPNNNSILATYNVNYNCNMSNSNNQLITYAR